MDRSNIPNNNALMERRSENHTVTAHGDDDNGGESGNQTEIGTCDAPTPATTNSTEPYSSGSGISSITMTPRTLLGQMPSLGSGTNNRLDKNSISTGFHCSPSTNSRSTS